MAKHRRPLAALYHTWRPRGKVPPLPSHGARRHDDRSAGPEPGRRPRLTGCAGSTSSRPTSTPYAPYPGSAQTLAAPYPEPYLTAFPPPYPAPVGAGVTSHWSSQEPAQNAIRCVPRPRPMFRTGPRRRSPVQRPWQPGIPPSLPWSCSPLWRPAPAAPELDETGRHHRGDRRKATRYDTQSNHVKVGKDRPT